MIAGLETLKQLTPDVFTRLNSLGDQIRQKINAVFGELEMPGQATGVGSLFGIHFTDEEITDYRSMLRGDQELKSVLYTGFSYVPSWVRKYAMSSSEDLVSLKANCAL